MEDTFCCKIKKIIFKDGCDFSQKWSPSKINCFGVCRIEVRTSEMEGYLMLSGKKTLLNVLLPRINPFGCKFYLRLMLSDWDNLTNYLLTIC